MSTDNPTPESADHLLPADRRAMIAGIGGLAAGALLAGSRTAHAGPLNPPAGPVASTGKTLTEVEPRIAINATNTPGDTDSLFKITQPGSYYLTGNIAGVLGKHGIEIAVSGVTIDLNGFDLAGVAGMGAFDGVSATVLNLNNIEIRNGSVSNWGDEGIDLGTFTSLNSIVRDVRSIGNVGNGITIGNASIVSGCTLRNNTGNGISANTGNGISGCTAYTNTGNGISAGAGTIISGCAVRLNSLNGILVTSQCTVFNNNCSQNGNAGDGAGISVAGSDNRIEGNQCGGADRGIEVLLAGNIIIRNNCSGNTINWAIAANNVVGPILDRTAPASAAISGNSAPDSTGSTHPNANFTY